MSHRRAAFLRLVGRCTIRRDACVRLVFFVLPRRGELVLSFQLQFEFGLSELFFELLIPFCKLRIAFSLGVNGPVQAIDGRARLIRRQHQRPQRRTTQMRTVSDIGTGMFMVGIKAELHRHPFRKQDAMP
jgi:hypothetical protein